MTGKLDPSVCAKIERVIAKYRKAYEARDYDYFFYVESTYRTVRAKRGTPSGRRE